LSRVGFCRFSSLYPPLSSCERRFVSILLCRETKI
jgi:hypothetical protein